MSGMVVRKLSEMTEESRADKLCGFVWQCHHRVMINGT